jgi:hypothetical protein
MSTALMPLLRHCRPLALLLPLVLGCGGATGLAASPTPPMASTSAPTSEAAPRATDGPAGAGDDANAGKDAAPEPAPAPPPDAQPSGLIALVVRDLSDAPAPPGLDAVVMHVGRAEWQKAKKALAAARPGIEEGGAIDVRIVTHALGGRIAAALKDKKTADTEYDLVLKTTPSPEAIDAIGGSDVDKQRRRQTVALAVGEALFHFAEKKAAEAEKLQPPRYTGSGEREEVLEFINAKVGIWTHAKRTAVEDAEREFVKILTQKPAPHPRWVIAAGARVGALWWGFVSEFRSASPLPSEWKGHGNVAGSQIPKEAIRVEFQRKIDEVSEAELERARAAFKACREQAARYAFVNDHSKTCETWLSLHAK